MERGVGKPRSGRLGVLAIVAAATLTMTVASLADSSSEGSVTVSVTGEGQVMSTPPGIACGSACTANFALATPVTLIAEAAPGFHFAAWRGACSGSSPRCETTADEDTRAQAEFAPGATAPKPEAIPLLVTRAGNGSITSSPEGVIDCGATCSTAFSGGGRVTLIATPGPDSVFEGWTGSCSATARCELALTEARAATATFRRRVTAPGTSTLTVRNQAPPPPPPYGRSGTGTVRLSWLGNSFECIEGMCQYTIPNGTKVTLDPLPRPLSLFNDWDGGCVGASPPCVLIMDGDAPISLSFRNTQALSSSPGLNLTRSGGGVVNSVPPGIECGSDAGCTASFKFGVVVKLTATGGPGYAFAGWSGDCSGTASCAVAMDVERSVSAVFRLIRAEVRVMKRGRGSGVVAREPSGIYCGADCATTFRSETTVTLHGTADAGSRFSGWSGTCSGTGPCQLTVHDATELTARFDRCAADTISSFRISAARSPRRATIRLELSDLAAGRIRIVRQGRTLLSKRFPSLARGQNSLPVSLPPRVAPGQARVELTINDLCGGTRLLTRTTILPR